MEGINMSTTSLDKFAEDKSARTYTLLANDSNFKIINEQILIDLEKKSKSIGTNARICMHDASKDHANEMIIAQLRKCFFPPKLHLIKNKSFTILSGKLGVYTFDIDGNLIDYIILGDRGSIYTYIKSGVYHVDIPITQSSIHLEIISGPNLMSTDLVHPTWYKPIHRQDFLDALPLL
jgi:cupin fold WbuC family metalloprotein